MTTREDALRFFKDLHDRDVAASAVRAADTPEHDPATDAVTFDRANRIVEAIVNGRTDATQREASATFELINKGGLHTRPAVMLLRTAKRFDAEFSVRKEGGAREAKCRCLTGLLTLCAGRGDRLIVAATGPDAQVAVEAFGALIAAGFGLPEE